MARIRLSTFVILLYALFLNIQNVNSGGQQIEDADGESTASRTSTTSEPAVVTAPPVAKTPQLDSKREQEIEELINTHDTLFGGKDSSHPRGGFLLNTDN